MYRVLIIFISLYTTITGINVAAASDSETPPPPLKLEALLKSNIQSVDDHEVLISRVTMQPEQTLPLHTHPTEEYLYIVSGKTTLKIANQDGIELSAGTAYKIPAETAHTALTSDQTAEIIVFRVHKKGKPVRTLVE